MTGGVRWAGREVRTTGWLAIAVCAATLLLCPTSVAARAPRVLTLPQYRAALQRSRAEAVAALAQTGAGVALARRQPRIMSALPVHAQVRMPSGVLVSVDNSELLQRLSRAFQQPAPAVRRVGLRQYVGAIDRVLAAIDTPAPRLNRARADQVLRSVLRRPEYQTKDPGPSLEERIIAWLGRMLRRLFPGTAVASTGGEGLARLMMAVVVLLLAVLIARIVVLVLPDLRRRRREDPKQAPGVLVLPTEPVALLAAAEAEAAAGRYREALRLAYLAMVARLDRAGVLPEDRSRTHWELLQELRRSEKGALYQQLAPVTRRVDERLFGGRESTVDDYQACRQAYDQIERLLCAPA